jgi:hypothetical protein
LWHSDVPPPTIDIIDDRSGNYPLLVALAVAVAAGGGLVKIGFVAHRLRFRRHLAGVAGVDAVVAIRDRRVRTALWWAEIRPRNSQSFGSSGSPYSAIPLAPAYSLV